MFNEGDEVVVVEDHEVYPGLYIGRQGVVATLTTDNFYRVIFNDPFGRTQGFFKVEGLELVGGQVPTPAYMELFE